VPPRDCLEGTAYRSIETIGRGAMGRVVAAEHRLLKRQVCVKLIEDALAADAGMLDRFRIEAQTLATLADGSHPRLLHVQDYGITPAGQPFLVMERLHGRSLQDERKARSAVPWREAVGFVLDALEGLAVAHAAGIVHRDVKPANLFVCNATDGTSRRRVKVLDFGIAKILHTDGPVAPGAVPTAAGMMLGTPRYASPEQLSARGVDARTDLYGVALVLYELLSGEVPFAKCLSLEDICVAQVLETLPSVRDEVPSPQAGELDAIIARGSAKDVDQRYESAQAMAAALERVIARADMPEASEPATTPRPLRSASAAAPPRRDTLKIVPKGRTVPMVLEHGHKDALELDADLARELGQTLPGRVAPRRRASSGRFVAVALASAFLVSLLGWWALHALLGARR